MALFFLAANLGALHAQADYQGSRLAVFDLKISKTGGSTLNVHCAVANTGRLPVVLNGRENAPFPPLAVEMDTLRLPGALRQYPALMRQALLREKISLAPGEVRSGLSLTVQWRDTLPEAISLPACTDLVIDTAYLLQKNERTLSVQFRLRNAGASPVRLLGGGKELLLNAYFVSGNKLTRGAILAEQIHLSAVRELSNGMLPAGASVTWTLEIPTRNRTRFSPHLALEFDPLQALPDCGRNLRVWVVEQE